MSMLVVSFFGGAVSYFAIHLLNAREDLVQNTTPSEPADEVKFKEKIEKTSE